MKTAMHSITIVLYAVTSALSITGKTLYSVNRALYAAVIHCNTLQPTATHCNPLQHTATHTRAKEHYILSKEPCMLP